MSLINRSLIKGSLILLIAFNVYNVLNFLFQFIMARALSHADYGVLASLFSFIYIMGVFTDSIQTVVAKNVAKKQENGKVHSFISHMLRVLLVTAFVCFLFYLIAILFLSPLLKINYWLLALNGLMIFLAILIPINRGALQGKKRFLKLSGSLFMEGGVKIILALLFIFVGWGIFGAIGAIILGNLFALGFSFYLVRDIFESDKEDLEIKTVFSEQVPTFLMLATLVTMYSLDVIFVRIFFDADIAGEYAIISLLAKALFWGVQPISRAMLPLSVENTKNRKESKKIFYNALAVVSFCLLFGLLVFYIFPEKLFYILSGENITIATETLIIISLGISFLAICNLILFSRLASGRVKPFRYLPIFILIEVVLMFFLSDNLIRFSYAFLLSATIFLICLIILGRYENKYNNTGS